MSDTPREMVGTYRFVFSEEMRRHWEERLRGQSPEQFAAAMAEVVAEATAAQITITESGQIASSANGTEFYRTSLRMESGVVCFDKPSGARVTVEQPDRDTLVADEAGKPQMRFSRLVR